MRIDRTYCVRGVQPVQPILPVTPVTIGRGDEARYNIIDVLEISEEARRACEAVKIIPIKYEPVAQGFIRVNGKPVRGIDGIPSD